MKFTLRLTAVDLIRVLRAKGHRLAGKRPPRRPLPRNRGDGRKTRP